MKTIGIKYFKLYCYDIQVKSEHFFRRFTFQKTKWKGGTDSQQRTIALDAEIKKKGKTSRPQQFVPQ